MAGPQEVVNWCQYQSGYSAGWQEVESARQQAFSGLGLYFQRDFIGIHTHPDASEAWNEGHAAGIRDALAAPLPQQ
ncbi:MAG: hypothetical protein PHU04_04150 [Candidatus Peribacteraceae bacterium]|nr:hypothetical protein [Candidatus Peribacteraceae bacterium]